MWDIFFVSWWINNVYIKLYVFSLMIIICITRKLYTRLTSIRRCMKYMQSNEFLQKWIGSYLIWWRLNKSWKFNFRAVITNGISFVLWRWICIEITKIATENYFWKKRFKFNSKWLCTKYEFNQSVRTKWLWVRVLL